MESAHLLFVPLYMLVGFYDISTFVCYLTPNPFFMKMEIFQTISTQFKCKYSLIVKKFFFKLFSLVKQF